MEVAAELAKIIGKGNIIVSKAGEKPFSQDKSYFKGVLPIAVARPKDAAQISRIMKFCNMNKINVVTRGGGSSLTGSSLPTKKSIILDMSRFTRILETHLEDGYIIAESGVTLGKINEHLARFNYFYPPDPASASFATVGGTISTNAGGLRAVMYGPTKLWVLGLEIVLPTGEIVETGGKTIKRSVGYDFTSLIVGSEGTLGIVTKAILKIIPRPQAVGRIAAYYKNTDNAIMAVSGLKRNGIVPLSAEFLDDSAISFVRKYRTLGIPSGARSMLIVDLASTKESLDKSMKNVWRLLSKLHPIKVISSKSAKGMEELLIVRRNLYQAGREVAEKTGRRMYVSDVIVPTSQLSVTIKRIKQEVARSGFEVELFSHIGDGNIHVNVIAKQSEMGKVYRLLEKFGDAALEHRGSVSGEHGIGLEKKKLLVRELEKRKSMPLLEKMREIKKIFDPNGILNKGKVFD